jgi:hypothetical protein
MNSDSSTFYGLMKQHSFIRIPMIQRDYAQGRASASELRTELVKNLANALTAGTGLDLDFVYGFSDSSHDNAFCPLDGQQRLTTLFLLHWYLSCRAGKHGDFKERMVVGGKSRFHYAIRPSSAEFFDALAQFKLTDFTRTPSQVIEDQTWYFQVWKFDPTVSGSLVMLDAIHREFKPCQNTHDAYNALDSKVTFQLLNMGKVGLSDDLYVKMNARGKPLTPFEQFKAQLEGDFPDKSMKQSFCEKIDKKWTDLFWNYRDKGTHLFDQQMMRFIRAVAIITLPLSGEKRKDHLEVLRGALNALTYFNYKERGCINPEFVRMFELLLDRWCGDKGFFKTYLEPAHNYKEAERFEALVKTDSEPSYADSILLYAYAKVNTERPGFSQWMRVIFNLAVNTRIDGWRAFTEAIQSVDILATNAENILEYLNIGKEIDGFDKHQVGEERIKARLILNNREWLTHIERAEQHNYFQGQIDFLLAFSGAKEPGNTDAMDKFNFYWERAAACFGDKGLNDDPEFLWERALLCTGDYLLNHGQHLLWSNTSEYWNWRLLLRGGEGIDDKRHYVKDLLDEIDPNEVSISLKKVISKPAKGIEDWREKLISRLEYIGFCKNRRILRKDGVPSLLLAGNSFKSRWAHLDIYSILLNLKDRLNRKELEPFEHAGYHWAKGEYPCAWIKWDVDGKPEMTLNVARVSDSDSSLQLTLLRWDDVLDQAWQKLAEELGFLPEKKDGEKDHRFGKTIPPNDLNAEITALVNGIKANMESSQDQKS